ncbi:hypothetical protein C0991_003019 [Blastosporella zonata]|nr:hypothetical protein C0991_003019 [Blastosporella zonata]
MIAGFFFVRPIPLPPTEAPEEGRRSPVAMEEQGGEESALLAAQEGVTHVPTQLSRRAALNQGLSPNVYGRKLWTSSDFWLLFSILSMLAGTGLMFINNVGSMSQALYIQSVEVYNPVDAARWQADQVSFISLLNFSSRIFIGLVSDYAKNRFGFPRSYSLVLVSSLFFLSQVMAALVVTDIKHLWLASATLGLAHGSVFSLFPNVCLEWFGMPHFSENWGYLSASPIVAGNLFSVVFGHNLDAHDSSPSDTALLASGAATTTLTGTCKLGRECYVDALYLTMGACFLSILLSVWAGWRDRKKLAVGAAMARQNRASEVIWEGPGP